MRSNSLDPLVRQLSLCGQIADHKAQMLREHGGAEASVLDALTTEQQNQLAALLAVLQKRWLDDHAAHHQK